MKLGNQSLKSLNLMKIRKKILKNQRKMRSLILVEMVKNQLMSVKMEKEKMVLESLMEKVKRLRKKQLVVKLVVWVK